MRWALSTGCDRAVLGTAALHNPGWCARAIATYGERIAVGLDVRVVEEEESTQYRLSARGRPSDSDEGSLWETLAWLDREGCARYVLTDVDRDGSLQGPNMKLYMVVTEATSTPVIASGGISVLADLVTLAEFAVAGANLEGAILGKSLYAGRFSLGDALKATQSAAQRLSGG